MLKCSMVRKDAVARLHGTRPGGQTVEMPSRGGGADSTLRKDVSIKGSYVDIRARHADISVSSHL